MSDGVQVSAGNVVGGAPAEQAATSPQPLCGDDALLDVGLLTDEFARIARHISEGNRRDLNRLRAMALGFTQEELKARLPLPARPRSSNHSKAISKIGRFAWLVIILNLDCSRGECETRNARLHWPERVRGPVLGASPHRPLSSTHK